MKFFLSLLLPVCISLAPLYSVSEVPDLLPVYKSDQLDADEQITLEDLAIALGTANMIMLVKAGEDVEKALSTPGVILGDLGVPTTREEWLELLEELRIKHPESKRVRLVRAGLCGAFCFPNIVLELLHSAGIIGNNPAEEEEASQIVLTDSEQEQLIISL